MRRAHPNLAAGMLMIVVSCSSVTPASFSAKPPPLAVRWPGPLSVKPVHVEHPRSRFNADGAVFAVDLDRFSDELARLLRESLENAGTSTAAGGKTLEVQVIYLDFMFQGPCLVDYRVQLGNGAVFGAQAAGEGAVFPGACRTALESAVREIAADARTVEYARGH